MPTIFFFFLRDGLKGLASAKRCQELIKTTYLHQHIPALQKQTQPWDGAGSQEPLTLYRWENSISRGVRRDRGNGFTVTEMTLELRTVLFLGRRGQREALEGFLWIPRQPSLMAQGLVCTRVWPHYYKIPPEIFAADGLHLLGSPHSQSLRNQTIYEPFQPLKQLGLESVSIPEIKYSWAHFLSLPRGNTAHLDSCRSLPTQNIQKKVLFCVSKAGLACTAVGLRHGCSSLGQHTILAGGTSGYLHSLSTKSKWKKVKPFV